MAADGAGAQQDAAPVPSRLPPHEIALTTGRVAAYCAALLLLYYLLPLDRLPAWAKVAELAVGLAVLIAMISYAVRAVRRASFPRLREVEALAVIVPLFLILFASTYFVLDKLSATNFSEHLTRTDALYFTVTVFSTVGFGDITAKTEIARILVTVQMIADVVIIGVAIKILAGAARSMRSRTPSDSA